jgi:Transglycosylase SLT domain
MSATIVPMWRLVEGNDPLTIPAPPAARITVKVTCLAAQPRPMRQQQPRLAAVLSKVRRVATRIVQRGPGVVEAARGLIAAGHSVDLGPWQINSRNLELLGLTVKQAFDPCHAVAAAGRLIELQSRYNTGSPTRGIANGYAAAVTASVRAVRAQPSNVIPADTPTAQQEGHSQLERSKAQ